MFARVGGSGPAVVLLHGFPETHACWHRIAPALAEHFTVVCLDLRGYGASYAPRGDGSTTYSKRQMACRCRRRHGRARPSAASRLVGTIAARASATGWRSTIPTGCKNSRCSTSCRPACSGNRSAPAASLRRIGPTWRDQALRRKTRSAAIPQAISTRCWRAGRAAVRSTRSIRAPMPAYRAAYVQPARIHAFCEDYRAGATSDVEADDADLAAGRTIACPALLLWSEYLTRGDAASAEPPPATWRRSFAPHLARRHW